MVVRTLAARHPPELRDMMTKMGSLARSMLTTFWQGNPTVNACNETAQINAQIIVNVRIPRWSQLQ
eukprot:scaffold393540_cov14-Prasinocladus_malaysianus.AAC.1